MSPVHGTPEGYDAGCTDVLTCPATHVHGLSCATAYVRFATGERQYMQLVGRNARPAQIARALGITPQSAVAKELEDMPAHRVPAALAKAERATELALRVAHPAVFAAADDLLEAELAARGQFNPEPAPEPAPIPEESPMVNHIGHTPVHALSSDLSREDRAACRQWAYERGFLTSPTGKGRIPNTVVEMWLKRYETGGIVESPEPIEATLQKGETVTASKDLPSPYQQLVTLAREGAPAPVTRPEPAPWPRPITTPVENGVDWKAIAGRADSVIRAIREALDIEPERDIVGAVRFVKNERDKAIQSLGAAYFNPDGKLKATLEAESRALEFALRQWALASDRASAAEYTAAMLTAHVQHLTDKVNAQGRELADRRRGWFR